MTTTISVPAGKLRLMLTAVLPHAGEDDTLPALCAVSFEVRGGWLYLAATDRYTIAIARESIPGAVAAGTSDISALLPADAARDLRRLLRKRDGTAAILIADGRLTVDGDGVSASWATARGKFPDWRPLLHGPLTGTDAPLGDKAGVNAEKLARITGMADHFEFESLSIRFLMRAGSEGNPEATPMVLATAGGWYLSAVMPTRRIGGSDPDAGERWREWAAVTAPAGKAEDAAVAEPDTAPAEVAVGA